MKGGIIIKNQLFKTFLIQVDWQAHEYLNIIFVKVKNQKTCLFYYCEYSINQDV